LGELEFEPFCLEVINNKEKNKMPSQFNKSAASSVTNREVFIVEADSKTVSEFKKLAMKTGVTEFTKTESVSRPGVTVKPGGQTGPAAPTPTAPAPEQVEDEQTKFEIDTRLQILVSSIPIAQPGNIITSEYHNKLRDAVHGLASRIGLSVNPTAEFKILTFAPNFLPVKTKESEPSNLSWNVTLERAAIPNLTEAEEMRKTVAGGFVVQLPDGATISEMIVRGERAAAVPKPKKFTVFLNRKQLGKDEDPLQLIKFDLRDIKEGAFEESGSVKLTDQDLKRLDEDEAATGTTVGRRKTVNNEKWMYYVTAEFQAGDNTAADKIEIHSIQILCIN
jgi:hypothetical protein